jgi:hypothetical protein
MQHCCQSEALLRQDKESRKQVAEIKKLMISNKSQAKTPKTPEKLPKNSEITKIFGPKQRLSNQSTRAENTSVQN